ncbi:MAG: hypothetical protein BGO39_15665 [Chloroflexi bacterium 54-19]|nr:MAG: hypothetical protein BGO39_15665 [Chloroflexi bacterium 54-19]
MNKIIQVSDNSLIVPPGYEKRLLIIPNKGRSLGIHLQAGKGAGKSRFIGRILAWLDFIFSVALIILDPLGPSISNFLDKLTRLPSEQQRQLGKRVRYIDMSGKAGIVGFPLYYRLGKETLLEISQRYLEVIRTNDPNLQNASIEGYNSLTKIGTPLGMILAALDLQITEAENLLTNPHLWTSRFEEAIHRYPEVKPAVDFFTQQYMEWDEATRIRRTDAFRTKIAAFSYDPLMKAMFGASQPGLDWDQVVANREAVLLDFGNEHNLEQRKFKMMWVFTSFMEWIKHRGAGHHHPPVSFIIDELVSLMNVNTAASAGIFAHNLEELINVYARNYNIWLTIAHQELYQLDPNTQKTLLTMGTQIFGSSADIDAALTLAKNLFPYDPEKVKRYEPIYSSFQGKSSVIDYRPINYTIEEQKYLKAYELKNRNRFEFIVRPATGEGQVSPKLHRVSIENFDKGIWVDEEVVTQARAILVKRSSRPITEVLKEIEARTAPEKPATINTYERPTRTPVSSKRTRPSQPKTQQNKEQDNDEDDIYFGVHT